MQCLNTNRISILEKKKLYKGIWKEIGESNYGLDLGEQEG